MTSPDNGTVTPKATAAMDQARYKEIKNKIKAYPHLEEKIYLQLLLHLHERHYTSINDIYATARKEVKSFKYDHDQPSPNVGPEHWSSSERRVIRRLTLTEACKQLADQEIDDLIFSVVKRDYIYALENIANLSDVSFGVLADKVREFNNIPRGTPLPKEEVMGLRVSLIRHFVSDQLDFIRIAKHHISLRDMAPIVENTLGSASGHGRIGGKAAGMLLGYKILQSQLPPDEFAKIRLPESYYVRTDVFEDFLSLNSLTKYQHHKYKPLDEIRDEYPAIKEVFRNGEFPEYLVRQCRALLKKIGKHPLIVRSSSLLEDNFQASFSGKYKSLFIGNQGSLNHRLAALLTAIGEVYASGLAPDPLAYRQERDLLDYDERLGILIQKVVGTKYNGYFLPHYAGVALSRNDYTWSPRLKPEDGLMRLVMGLGTRAVDRVGDDYPRLVGLTAPTLRPEVTYESQKKYSQRFIDVINLRTDSFETIALDDFWGSERWPGYEDILAIDQDGYLQPPYAAISPTDYRRGVVTFDKLLSGSSLPGLLKKSLKILTKTYGCPIDVEFSHDGANFYLLQTRAMAYGFKEKAVPIPRSIPAAQRLFSTQRHTHNARIDNIDYVIYCDPRAYAALPDDHTRYRIARIIGLLNLKLANKRFILMGPGRWGSSSPRLGVPVQYSEINNTKALIEIAYREGLYTPEVSFGTHFFLDLVEKGIHYLPLFPDDPDNTFNDEFFDSIPNSLAAIILDAADFSAQIKVLDVHRDCNGRHLNFRMNGKNKFALAYFKGKAS